jgi:hypothetical protein
MCCLFVIFPQVPQRSLLHHVDKANIESLPSQQDAAGRTIPQSVTTPEIAQALDDYHRAAYDANTKVSQGARLQASILQHFIVKELPFGFLTYQLRAW